jgi:uncharacterized protein with PIN domain
VKYFTSCVQVPRCPIMAHMDAKAPPEFSPEYKAYIVSPAWFALTLKVAERSRGWCEHCLTAHARVVHHLNYVRLGHELLTDLVHLCLACHQGQHPGRRLGGHVKPGKQPAQRAVLRCVECGQMKWQGRKKRRLASRGLPRCPLCEGPLPLKEASRLPRPIPENPKPRVRRRPAPVVLL